MKREGERPIIFIDLDGVLVDFDRGVADLFGNADEVLEDWREGETIEEILARRWGTTLSDARELMWEAIDAGGSQWWANLDATPHASEVLTLAGRLAGPERLFFASSPSRNGSSASGKMLWIRKRVPDPVRSRQFVLTPHKHLLAAKNRILFDDSKSNVKKFEKAGGLGILVPSRHNLSADSPLRGNVDVYLRRQVAAAGYIIRSEEEFEV